MGKKSILMMADRLMVYAIERQAGADRNQPPNAPPWRDQRRFWTDSILQGMARLDGLTPDPHWMEEYDRRLEAAKGCSAVERLSPGEQAALVRNLSRYVSALENTGDDHRRQIAVIGSLLEDMAVYLSWDNHGSGLSHVRDQVENALQRMTAQLPIRFTRILLGGDTGPYWESGFVSGSVTEINAVKRTDVYERARRLHPEITEWPALCTVYVGHGLPSALGTRDACEFDLGIMNQMGDRFLDERGVSCVGGPYQMTVSSEEQQVMENCPLLQGMRPLKPEDLEIYEYFGDDEGRITFCLDVMADERAVFGRELTREGEDTYAVVYGTYDETTSQVCELLDVEQRLLHSKNWFCCKLTDEVRESLRQKMDIFYAKMYGESLPLREQPESPPFQMDRTM